jgi:hypothetical protein
VLIFEERGSTIRGVSAFRFIRGNEADRYASGPKNVPLARYSLDPGKSGNPATRMRART